MYPCNDKMQKLSILLPLWSACIYIRYLAQLARHQSRDILKSRNKCEGAVLGNQDGWYLTMFLSRRKKKNLVDFIMRFPYCIYISNQKSEKSSDLSTLGGVLDKYFINPICK